MKMLRVYSGYDSKYWRAVAGVFTGSVIAQSIPVLGALLIARLYMHLMPLVCFPPGWASLFYSRYY